MNTRYLLSFFLLIVSEYVFATQLVINDSSSEYYVAPKIEWLVDSAENPSQAMSFSDILALPDGAFNTGIGEKANLSRDNDIFWVRFSIKNKSSIDFWFLELAYPRVGDLLLYKQVRGIVKHQWPRFQIMHLKHGNHHCRERPAGKAKRQKRDHCRARRGVVCCFRGNNAL